MHTTDTVEAVNERLRLSTINLREDNFKNGRPFMMLSKDLLPGEAYIEYPDGRIDLTILSEEENAIPTVLRTLSASEASRVRKAYGL